MISDFVVKINILILDILILIAFIMAAIKGYQRGLIVAVFSIIAFIVGLAAAIKLSAVVADYIGKATSISQQWLPVISFAIVFIIVILLVRWTAALIQKSVEFAMMGWINKLGGILFYICIYILIYSVVLFYADQIELIKPEWKNNSVTYSYIEPVGPAVMNYIGKILPFFKDMFASLEHFFGDVSDTILPGG